MSKIRFTTFAKPKTGIMTKEINLVDGKIVKDSSKCRMATGSAKTYTKSFKELPELLDSAEKRYAVAWGVVIVK